MKQPTKNEIITQLTSFVQGNKIDYAEEIYRLFIEPLKVKSEENQIELPLDATGRRVKIGDKVRGEGFITFQDGFKIDRSPTVTVRVHENTLYFGGLSAQSFPKFWIVDVPHTKPFASKGGDKLAEMQSVLREHGINTMFLNDEFNSNLFAAMEQYHLRMVEMNRSTNEIQDDLNFMLKLSETWNRRGREWFAKETWERISDIRSRMFYSSLTEDEKKQISKSEKSGT
jgi:hypothetical protein